MKASQMTADALDAPGLPRPLRSDPRDQLRPVPWTQGAKEWGDIDSGRMAAAVEQALCLVCGLYVAEGTVLWCLGPFNGPAPAVATHRDLGRYKAHVADGGAMHTRCARMTAAHCRHIAGKLSRGELVEVPYVDMPEVSKLTEDLDSAPTTA